MADVVTVWNPFIITNNGLNLRQQAIATGRTVAFNYAEIGQGAAANPSNIPLMTALVSSAAQVPVVRTESDGPTHFVGVRIDNIDYAQPVLMREIGLFASIDGNAPILYGYTCAAQGYDSIPAGNVAHYIWTIGINTVLSRAQSISFVYDGSKVYVTHKDLADAMADEYVIINRLYKLLKLIPLTEKDYTDPYFPIMPIDGGQFDTDLSGIMIIDGDLFDVPYSDYEYIDAGGFDAEYFGSENIGAGAVNTGNGTVLDGGTF